MTQNTTQRTINFATKIISTTNFATKIVSTTNFVTKIVILNLQLFLQIVLQIRSREKSPGKFLCSQNQMCCDRT